MRCPECGSRRLFIRLSGTVQGGMCLDCEAQLIRAPGGQFIPRSITEVVRERRAS